MDEKLLLATWNIRDFDKPAYGERSDEAIAYIAEVISYFDLVALQEIYRDLTALKRVMAGFSRVPHPVRTGIMSAGRDCPAGIGAPR